MKQVESLKLIPIQAIADHKRHAILKLLAKSKSLTVTEIVEGIKQPQNLVSHHLGVLRRFGAVEVKNEGVFRHYKINKKAIKAIIAEFSSTLK